jgi:excisionase family DNA binding protein
MGLGKKWSEKEIEYLDENWGKSTLASLSTHLKRTKKAVVLKSKRLKLGASTRADEYLTANQVAVLLNINNHTVLRWIKYHHLKADKKVLLYKRRFFLIKHSDLLKWLENNQDKFDSRRIDYLNLGYEPEWLQRKKERDKKLPINRFKIWTKFEVQRIKKLSRNMTYKEIAKIMGRSHDSIERKFGRLQDRQKLLQIKEVTYANNAQ